jgi:cell wall-associated NlpC family hydrolase
MKRKWIRMAAAFVLTAILTASPAWAATIGGATVTGSDVRLRSEASVLNEDSIITEMPAGTFLLVEEKIGNWYKAVLNGKEGYVYSSYVSFSEDAEGTYSFSSVTSGTNVNLRAAASTTSNVLKNLQSAGSALTITGVSGEWLKVRDAAGASGYIRSDLMRYKDSQAEVAQAMSTPSAAATYVAAAAAPTVSYSASSTGGNVAQTVQQYVGCAYTWGGMSPTTGFDCSGLVNYVYKLYGVSLHRVAQDIYSYDGVFVSNDDIQPGDILCFGYGPYSVGHVGIYIGNGKMVHASTYTTGVIYSDFNCYTNTNFVGAKRVA